jgi:hypothetical protein
VSCNDGCAISDRITLPNGERDKRCPVTGHVVFSTGLDLPRVALRQLLEPILLEVLGHGIDRMENGRVGRHPVGERLRVFGRILLGPRGDGMPWMRGSARHFRLLLFDLGDLGRYGWRVLVLCQRLRNVLVDVDEIVRRPCKAVPIPQIIYSLAAPDSLGRSFCTRTVRQ